VKTRLIPALGAAGAARLHRMMLSRALDTAAEAARHTGWAAQLWLAGAARPACPPFFTPHRQQGRDLGERMARAFIRAFAGGARRVVLMGTDCPGVDSALLRRAFAALEENDLVLGPAHDGGYYLIGQRRHNSGLFTGMPWGTAAVLPETLARAGECGLRVFLLDTLHDIDTPEDLEHIRHYPGFERGADSRGRHRLGP